MKKLLFIYNPHAGRGQARGKLAGILNSFARSDCLTTVYPTQGPGDAAWRPGNWPPVLTGWPAAAGTALFTRWWTA